jgi:hypothetical protein
MEEARTSETSVSLYQATRRNNSEDGHLNTRFFLCKFVEPFGLRKLLYFS